MSLFQIPVTGFFHIFEMDDPPSDEFAAEILLTTNSEPGADEDPRPVPARIEVRVDDVANAATIWFMPDPRLPQNTRARQVAADAYGWHMIFHGTVLIDGMSDHQIAHYVDMLG